MLVYYNLDEIDKNSENNEIDESVNPNVIYHTNDIYKIDNIDRSVL